jgi:hypothetical protein
MSANMSTEQQDRAPAEPRAEGWGRIRILRSPPVRRAPDPAEIARTLTEKYGMAALAFARSRAARAVEVGDEMALDAWRSVIEATKALLRRPVGP